MNRRDFLKNFALGSAGLYVSTKTIFLPPSGGWPAYTSESDLLRALSEAYEKGRYPDLIIAQKSFIAQIMGHHETTVLEARAGKVCYTDIYQSNFGSSILQEALDVDGFELRYFSGHKY